MISPIERSLWPARHAHASPAGMEVMSVKPKTGKSIAVTDMCLAIATGGRVFGAIDVNQVAILYYALEDGQRRIQKRLKTILGGYC